MSRLGFLGGGAWSDVVGGVWFRVAGALSRWNLEWSGFQRAHGLGGLGRLDGGCSFA